MAFWEWDLEVADCSLTYVVSSLLAVFEKLSAGVNEVQRDLITHGGPGTTTLSTCIILPLKHSGTGKRGRILLLFDFELNVSEWVIPSSVQPRKQNDINSNFEN